MRTLAVIMMTILLAACSSNSTQTAEQSTPPSTAGTTSSATSSNVLSWGGSGSTAGVFIQVSQPQPSSDPVIGVNGKPDPTQRFVVADVLVGNKTQGKAKVWFSGRVGAVEAPPVADQGPVPGVLPGEGLTIKQRFRVPVDAQELVLEVGANVDEQPNHDQLVFKGPLV